MRGAHVDANQVLIVQALRTIGASVQHLHAVGQGCPDLLVGYGGQNYALEIKDGAKPPSARALTPQQAEWHDKWRGHVAVVCTPKEAFEAIGVPFRGQVS